MRVKHFIVTYRNDGLLDKCIDTILATPTDHQREIFVIANHSSDYPNPREGVTVLRNVLRPDFSTGHLSRNWNQALMLGFVNLNDPQADLVICCQNDTEFEVGYLDLMINTHQRFDLITYGAGDNCVSYTAQAVRRVGLWDERFCNIGFQEADYFLRAAMYLNNKASINDEAHGRTHHPIRTTSIVRETVTGFDRRDPANRASVEHSRQSKAVYDMKWGQFPSEDWHGVHRPYPTRCEAMNFVLYPYFEGGVETLEEQNYLKPALN